MATISSRDERVDALQQRVLPSVGSDDLRLENCRSTGSAPDCSTAANVLRLAAVKLPVISVSPVGMGSWMIGADLTVPSSTMAICLLMFFGW